MEVLSPPRGAQNKLVQKKIAVVNPWDNKFTQLYMRYFEKHNDVRWVLPQSVQNLGEVLGWADLVWSQWANDWLAHISKQTFTATLATHIHSYEILVPDFMQNVHWPRVAGAIFVADHIRQNTRQLWGQEMGDLARTTIYNSVDPAAYPLLNAGPGKNVGYVGYLNHKKGVGLLLQCIKALVDADPEFALHIAGTFQEKRFEVYMKHLIEEMDLSRNIVFHGWVEDLQAWLAAMNYVISTSPWEGCPLNVIEAMACGIKPLIHNWQGAKVLFPEQFVFNTVDECLSIVNDPVYETEMIRDVVVERFNAERNIPMIEAFLVDCMGRHEKNHPSPSKQVTTTPKQSKRTHPLETAQNPTPAPAPKKGINFHQQLDHTVELSCDRKDFTVEFCRGKRVLHVGCVDAGLMDARIKGNHFLHYQIGSVARSVIGADIEQDGLDRLTDEGFEVHKLNLEDDGLLLKELSGRVDTIVIPEVIEHLNNVGKALENIKACRFKGDILISTPNAFSFRAFKHIGKCIELIHPDHNYYFSPTTLKTILGKYGFGIHRLIMYYWQTNDPVGQELQTFVTQNPYFAEGMIAIVKDLNQ